MKKSVVSTILKALMFKKDINTCQLARELNLPQQTLQRIVSGTSPNPHSKTLRPLAEYFDISLDQIRGKKPLPEAVVELSLPVTARSKSVPVIPWDQINLYLDNPSYVSELENIFTDTKMPQWVFATILGESSMEPYIPEGSLLILDPKKEPSDRNFVVVRLAESDTVVCRQLLNDGDMHYIKAMSTDLAEFPMRLLTKQDQVVAVVVEYRYRYS